ncbi:MAG TPA: SRPBCC family protein [Candidatus Obscuribacterales bacterium]
MSLKKYHGSGAFRQLVLGALSLVLMFLVAVQPLLASPELTGRALTTEQEKRLECGEILLGGNVERRQCGLVEGKILINSRPDRVWSIVINPLEFANKIQKHLRQVRIVKRTPRTSLQECQLELAAFFPRVKYEVESFYEPCKRIDFRRAGGMIKDFYGYWLLEPRDNGTKTLVTYAMFIDPGFFVPQWIMRQGLRRELPVTLNGIRDRALELEAQQGDTALLPPASG